MRVKTIIPLALKSYGWVVVVVGGGGGALRF